MAGLYPESGLTPDDPQAASEEADEGTALLRRPSACSEEGGAVSLTRALAIPGVLEFSLSLFFAKLVSYTFLYWLPLYINTSSECDRERERQMGRKRSVLKPRVVVVVCSVADAEAERRAVDGVRRGRRGGRGAGRPAGRLPRLPGPRLRGLLRAQRPRRECTRSFLSLFRCPLCRIK